MRQGQNKHPFFILFVAIATLILVSVLPIEKWSDGHLKNYNLFSDLCTISDTTNLEKIDLTNGIDPQLIAEIETTNILADSTKTNIVSQEIIEIDTIGVIDSIATQRKGDTILIEDYTENRVCLKNLKHALVNRQHLSRPVRIAFIGDSYIEGDIFSQHIRELLQDYYGGGGVGYMNMHSEFPGFRKSINQRSSGWTNHDVVNNNLSHKYSTIAQQYFVSTAGSLSSYTGRDYTRHTKEWNSTKFLFISHQNSTIKIKRNNIWQDYHVTGNDSVQCLSLADTISTVSIKTPNNGIIALGTWLEHTNGITLDCMSTRGNSGITLKRVNPQITHQIREYIDYDLIILEFGINAMSPGQTNFSAYVHHMAQTINHLKECYPNSDFLIMGIGDRGEKINGEVHSMKNVPMMIKAQRQLAMKTNCLFWDTREAMGGNDAAANWAEHTPPYMNKDYIHLSYTGGKVLAEQFVKSLMLALDE